MFSPRRIVFWLSVGMVILLSYCIHGYALGVASERLLRRVRLASFKAILGQDMAFFDQEENSTGSLISFISVQTANFVGISGVTLGTILSVTTTLIAVITLSITFAWKIGLVCTSMLPILLVCGFLGFYLLALLDTRTRSAHEKAAGYASEAVSAVRTVALLTRDSDLRRIQPAIKQPGAKIKNL